MPFVTNVMEFQSNRVKNLICYPLFPFPVKVKFLQPNVSFAICWKTHIIRHLIQVRRIVLQVVAFHVFAFEILFKHSNSQYTDLLIRNCGQFAET